MSVCVCVCPRLIRPTLNNKLIPGPKQNQHHKAVEAEAATITSALLVLTLATHAFAVCVLVSLSLFALSSFLALSGAFALSVTTT